MVEHKNCAYDTKYLRLIFKKQRIPCSEQEKKNEVGARDFSGTAQLFLQWFVDKCSHFPIGPRIVGSYKNSNLHDLEHTKIKLNHKNTLFLKQEVEKQKNHLLSYEKLKK